MKLGWRPSGGSQSPLICGAIQTWVRFDRFDWDSVLSQSPLICGAIQPPTPNPAWGSRVCLHVSIPSDLRGYSDFLMLSLLSPKSLVSIPSDLRGYSDFFSSFIGLSLVIYGLNPLWIAGLFRQREVKEIHENGKVISLNPLWIAGLFRLSSYNYAKSDGSLMSQSPLNCGAIQTKLDGKVWRFWNINVSIPSELRGYSDQKKKFLISTRIGSSLNPLWIAGLFRQTQKTEKAEKAEKSQSPLNCGAIQTGECSLPFYVDKKISLNPLWIAGLFRRAEKSDYLPILWKKSQSPLNCGAIQTVLL